MYRQGDILIIPVTEAPQGRSLPRRNGRLVVAEGEATGHAHAVHDLDVQMIEVAPEERYLVAQSEFALSHEEHATLTLPAGAYRIVRQREYTPDEIRRVVD